MASRRADLSGVFMEFLGHWLACFSAEDIPQKLIFTCESVLFLGRMEGASTASAYNNECITFDALLDVRFVSWYLTLLCSLALVMVNHDLALTAANPSSDTVLDPDKSPERNSENQAARLGRAPEPSYGRSARPQTERLQTRLQELGP
jgi:hypothetical protein